MDLFQAMQVFVKVADAGSFAGAARAMDLSNPSITRHVADLEAHLGARLFQRSTRRLSLTDTGATYLEHCRRLLQEVEEAALAAGKDVATPSGTLRINAPVSFSIEQLGRVLPEYRRRYPEVKLDITLSDRMVDVVEEGYDLAIRIARIRDASLIARRIAPARLVLCAAPSYLKRHGTPRTPEDLRQHDCLSYSYLAGRKEWQFTRAGRTHTVRVSGSVESNNGHLLRDAAVGGMGIVLQPSFIGAEDFRSGRLVRLLPQYQPRALDVYAVYPSRRHLPAKVRTFIDFLAEQFGEMPV